jgi:hypothetical protein
MAAAGAVSVLFDALQSRPDDAHLQHLGLMAAQVGFFFYAHLQHLGLMATQLDFVRV